MQSSAFRNITGSVAIVGLAVALAPSPARASSILASQTVVTGSIMTVLESFTEPRGTLQTFDITANASVTSVTADFSWSNLAGTVSVLSEFWQVTGTSGGFPVLSLLYSTSFLCCGAGSSTGIVSYSYTISPAGSLIVSPGTYAISYTADPVGSGTGTATAALFPLGDHASSYAGLNYVVSEAVTGTLVKVFDNPSRALSFVVEGDLIQPVPEPTTLLLVGGGLVAAARLRRRQRRRT